MQPTAYILTREINEYDQQGAYFEAWFHKMPSTKEVRAATKCDHATAGHIRKGGGRRGGEDEWWWLTEVPSSNSQP